MVFVTTAPPSRATALTRSATARVLSPIFAMFLAVASSCTAADALAVARLAICSALRVVASLDRATCSIDVAVDSDMRLIDFRAHEAEVAVRHGLDAKAWPRTEVDHLVDVELVPVIAPGLLASGPAIRTPADLLDHTLLHEENRSVWERWFAAAGLPDMTLGRAQIFAEGNLVLQAVLRGHGVALVDSFLAAEDIAAGRLVQPFDLSIRHGAYWLVARSFKRLSPEARAFRDWLLRRIEA